MLAPTQRSMRTDRNPMAKMMAPGVLSLTTGQTAALLAPTTWTSSTHGMMMDGMVNLGTMRRPTMTATTRTGPSTMTMAGTTNNQKMMEPIRR